MDVAAVSALIFAPPEQWRDVPGWEGIYQVSDHGRVWSYKTGIRKTPLDHHGRPHLSLTRDAQGVTRQVHVLVAAAFLGPCPEGLEVCHGDGDRTNNCVSNLRYDTRSNNNLDAVAHGNHNNASKTHCPRNHELTDGNLVPSSLAKGRRDCLTCSRERAREAYARKQNK